MGAKVILNTMGSQKCAFCKYWHDPTMSAIKPVLGKTWEFEPDIKKRCIKRGIDRKALNSCDKFVSKL